MCRKAYDIDQKNLNVFNKLYNMEFSKREFVKC